MRNGPEHNHVLQDAVIRATKRYDGGVTGYFRNMASARPARFARFLRYALVLEITHPVPDPQWELAERRDFVRRMHERESEQMRRRGLSDEQIKEVYQIQLSVFKKVVAPTKPTPKLREEIVAAAAQVGDNGHGRNGLIGYLNRLQNKCPDSFDGLVACLLASNIPFEESSNIVNCDEDMRQADLWLKEFHEILRKKGWLDAYLGYFSEAEVEATLAMDKS
jgi:hypothetical protein